ncbi:MAG: hypothetical protein WBD40_19000 [Tepidisphaeraceae bacterium]
MKLAAWCLAATVAVAAGSAALSTVADASEYSARVVRALNAERAANGIPAGIVERSDWSLACEMADSYFAENGQTHFFDPSKAGYTPQGAWAASNSVLGGAWFIDGYSNDADPYLGAPYHHMQLLSPWLAETGGSPGCQTTWPGYTRPAPATPQLFTFPGDGVRDVRFEEKAAESPYVPGDLVGLPEGTTTGPHLYVMPFGDERPGRLAGASLTGPNGPVDIRTVDGYSGQQVASDPGAFIIPVKPLRPNTTYAASAAYVDGAGVRMDRAWQFRTAGLDPTLTFEATKPTQVRVAYRPRTAATLTVTSINTGRALAQRKVRSRQDWAPRVYGRVRLCVLLRETGPYAPATNCQNHTWRATAGVRITLTPTALRVAAAPRARGRTATIEFVHRIGCSPAGCDRGAGSPLRRWHRTVRLARLLTLPFPAAYSAKADSIYATVTLPGYERGDIPYAGARLAVCRRSPWCGDPSRRGSAH